MKTSLHFQAPGDLSVGTVRIIGAGQIIADWVATPNNRTFQQDDLSPGIYSAQIGPAGLSPRSVLFEIREGQANNVVLPSFSALSSSGSNLSFFDIDSQQTVSEIPTSKSLDFLSTMQWDPEDFSSIQREGLSDPKVMQPIKLSTETRHMAIGLSEEKNGRETFDTFMGRSQMALVSGRLELEIPTDLRRDHWAGRRVRLSTAIERIRIERCLLPLYRGGTMITLMPPPFAPSDLDLTIMPVDPKLRALVRSLEAGSPTEVAAVRDDVLGNGDPAALLMDDADPWAAILTGLLAIRYPEVFEPIDPAWAGKLARRADWAFDSHVVRASLVLSAAGGATPEAQDEAVAKAVTFLSNAQVSGSPYYRYTNQLFGEMATGIDKYLKVSKPRVDASSVERFTRIYSRWRRELPLQRGAGSTFTWLSRDQAALKERGILVPYRQPSGRLRAKDTSIIFEGQVSAGQIAIISGALKSFSSEIVGAPFSPVERANDGREISLSKARLLARSPGRPDDPNKGRFGGQASREGFHLSVTFEPTTHRKWVTVNFTVEADRSTQIGLGDIAWFFLHPTFSPQTLKVSFKGNRARLRIQAWGGFTAGVLLPKSGVELECDLAQIEGAPKMIKLR